MASYGFFTLKASSDDTRRQSLDCHEQSETARYAWSCSPKLSAHVLAEIDHVIQIDKFWTGRRHQTSIPNQLQFLDWQWGLEPSSNRDGMFVWHSQFLNCRMHQNLVKREREGGRNGQHALQYYLHMAIQRLPKQLTWISPKTRIIKESNF